MAIEYFTVEKLTDTIIDYRGKTPPKVDKGIRLITAKVIKNGCILDDKHEYIADDFYDTWMRRGLPQKWDILLTTEAPLGEVAQIRTTEKVALAQRVILLRGDPELIDQQYFFQSIKSPFVQAGLKSRGTGTTVLGIKQSELRKVEIPLPPLSTQKNIASILSAYDDLIENNTRRIQILEEMAQRIYKEWFVDFKYPGHENDQLVDSELGMIPDGWNVKQLSDIAIIIDCLHSKKPEQFQEGSNIYLHVWNIGNGGKLDLSKISYISDYDYNVWIKRIEVEQGDCIITKTGRVGAVGRIPSNIKAAIGRNIVAIRWQEYPSYLFQYLMSKHKEKEIQRLRSSGTVMESIHVAAIEKFFIQIPSIRIIDKFEEKVGKIQTMIEVLNRKNLNLRQTRDLLLPKLISGKVDVSDLDIDTSILND